jgi:hypothetical protein
VRRRAFIAAATLVLASGPAFADTREKRKGGGLSYLPFPALTATAHRADGRLGVLSVEAGIDIPDGGLRRRAEQSQPLLRDAYSRWLTIYAGALAPGTAPDADEISHELQRLTDQVLGRPGAHLLLGTILVN